MKNIIIAVLTFFVLALSGYLIYETTNEEMSEAELKSELSDLKSDYKYIQKDLENSISKLHFSNQLIISQKQKIEELLKKNSITEEELSEAKKLMKSISNSIFDEFQNRVQHLEAEKQELLGKSIGNSEEIAKLNKKIKTLENTRKDLTNKYKYEKKESERKTELLAYATTLSLSNFTMKSLKVRNNGKEVETNKASRIDKIRVSFDINENILAESGKKNFYIAVYKPDGKLAEFENVAGGVINQANRQIAYSDKITVNYLKNQVNTVSFDWSNDEFERGEYTIEVYEDNTKRITKIGGATKKLE